MATLHEIERAITELPREQLASFRTWFAEFDAKVWDQQFAEDVAAGRQDGLADEALQDVREGRRTNR